MNSNISTALFAAHMLLVLSNLYLFLPVIMSLTGYLDSYIANYRPNPLLAPVIIITLPAILDNLNA